MILTVGPILLKPARHTACHICQACILRNTFPLSSL